MTVKRTWKMQCPNCGCNIMVNTTTTAAITPEREAEIDTKLWADLEKIFSAIRGLLEGLHFGS